MAIVSPAPRALARDVRRSRIICVPPMIPQNPYQQLLYEALAARGLAVAPDARLDVPSLLRRRRSTGIVHVHWPQSCYRHAGRGGGVLSWVKLATFVTRLATARALGYRVVWTVHQVLPHEVVSPRLDRAAAVVLARLSNALVAHERKTADDIRSLLPHAAAKTRIVPHGSYVGVYPPGRPRADVRSELGISPDAVVFLCFGHLRAYKEVDLLLEAFRQASVGEAVLVVAGLPLDDGLAGRLEHVALGDPRLRLLMRFIPDQSVAELFDAADVAVVPRGDGGTSGALILALSFSLPLIAARTRTAIDLVDDDGVWWFRPGDADELRVVLERAAVDVSRGSKKAAAAAAGAQMTWAKAAELLEPVMCPARAR